MTDPMRVDIVSDVVCPWCVIGYLQLSKASEQIGIALDIHWHPFELNPDMPEEGENLRAHLARKYGTSTDESVAARDRLKALGTDLGFAFEYADDMRMVNTFRAHQLIEWAEGHGLGHKAKLALFEAFFTRRENLNDIEVLSNVAAGIGLARDAARMVLDTSEKAASVRHKEQFWTSRGVTGVPAMVFAGRHLVTGAQGKDNYTRILRHLSESSAA